MDGTYVGYNYKNNTGLLFFVPEGMFKSYWQLSERRKFYTTEVTITQTREQVCTCLLINGKLLLYCFVGTKLKYKL